MTKKIIHLFLVLLIVNLVCGSMLTGIVSANIAKVPIITPVLSEDFGASGLGNNTSYWMRYSGANKNADVGGGIWIAPTNEAGYYFQTSGNSEIKIDTANIGNINPKPLSTSYKGTALRFKKSGGSVANYSLRKNLNTKIDFSADIDTVDDLDNEKVLINGVKSLIAETDDYKIEMDLKALVEKDTAGGDKGIVFSLAPLNEGFWGFDTANGNTPYVNPDALFSFCIYTNLDDKKAAVDVSMKNAVSEELEWVNVVKYEGDEDFATYNSKLHDIKLELVIKEDGDYKNIARLYWNGNIVDIDSETDFDLISIPELYDGDEAPIPDIKERTAINNIGSLYITGFNATNNNYNYLDEIYVNTVYTEQQGIDTTELEAAISAAEALEVVEGPEIGQYLPAAYVTAFLTALNNANEIFAGSSADQGAIAAAALALENATIAITGKANTIKFSSGGIIDSWDFIELPTENFRPTQKTNGTDEFGEPIIDLDGNVMPDSTYGNGSSVYNQNIADTTTFTLSEKSAFNSSFVDDNITLPDGVTSKGFYLEGPGAVLYADYDVMFESIIKDKRKVEIGFKHDVAGVGYNYCTAISFDGTTGLISIISNTNNIPKASTIPLEDGKWYRIRTAAYLTDQGAMRNRANAWINGEVLNSGNSPYNPHTAAGSANLSKSIDQFVIRNVNATPVKFDNLTIYKQNRFTPSAPLNKGALVTVIRNAEAILAKIANDEYTIGTNEGEYLQAVVDVFSEALEIALPNAKTVYENSASIQADINIAAASLKAIIDEFIPNEKPVNVEGEMVFLGGEGGETPVDSLADAGDNLIINQAIKASPLANSDTAIMFAALYSYEGETAAKENIEMKAVVPSKLVTLSADGTGTLTVTLPLEAYPDRSNLFVKIFIWEDSQSDIKPITLVQDFE